MCNKFPFSSNTKHLYVCKLALGFVPFMKGIPFPVERPATNYPFRRRVAFKRCEGGSRLPRMEEMSKSILKIMVIGDVAVGKTALVKQYVNKNFELNYKATIGADFLVKDILVEDQLVCLQIWDTAGFERYGIQFLNITFHQDDDTIQYF